MFTISDIASAGNLEKERVVLKATAAGDIGSCLVLRTNAAKDDGSALSGNIPDAFWFPDQEIAEGDLVVLYTKAGKRSSKKVEGGGTTHFFYWGRKNAIWDEVGYVLTLVKTEGWEAWSPSAPQE